MRPPFYFPCFPFPFSLDGSFSFHFPSLFVLRVLLALRFLAFPKNGHLSVSAGLVCRSSLVVLAYLVLVALFFETPPKWAYRGIAHSVRTLVLFCGCLSFDGVLEIGFVIFGRSFCVVFLRLATLPVAILLFFGRLMFSPPICEGPLSLSLFQFAGTLSPVTNWFVRSTIARLGSNCDNSPPTPTSRTRRRTPITRHTHLLCKVCIRQKAALGRKVKRQGHALGPSVPGFFEIPQDLVCIAHHVSFT